MARKQDDGKGRVKLHAQKKARKRLLRIVVTQPGVIDLRDGTHKGHPADLIEAPPGTKIERPKEQPNGC